MPQDSFEVAVGAGVQIAGDDTVFIYLNPDMPIRELMKFTDGKLATKTPDDMYGSTVNMSEGLPDSRNAVVVGVLAKGLKLDEVIRDPFVVAVVINEGSEGERVLFDVNQGGVVPAALDNRI